MKRNLVLIFLLTCVGCSEESPVQVQTKLPLNDATCFDYGDYLHAVALIATPGRANAVAADGDYVYVADGDYGLQIIDVNDKSEPILLGAVDTTGSALDVASQGDIVCVAFGPEGLVIVDVGNPNTPTIRGAAETPGNNRGVEISDTLAYVADDVVGLMLFDISDPSTPTTLGVENTPGEAVDVAIAGPLAYVADETLGLRVVNVTDPFTPWLVNTVGIPGLAKRVFVSGGYAYVAARHAGVQVIDISTAGSETVVGSLDTTGDALDVFVLDQILYAVDGLSGLRIAGISSPLIPEQLNIVSATRANGVAVEGGYVYIAETSGGVRIVNAVNPLPPPVVDRIAPTGVGTVLHVEATDSLVYGIALGITLFIADLEDGAGLVERGQAPIPFGQPNALLVKDGFAYVSVGSEGIVVYDVRDPDAPGQNDYLPFADGVRGLDVHDGVVYFATGGERIGVHELGSQRPPAYASAVAAKTTAVAVEAGFAFVAGEGNELIVVNVEDVSLPFVLGRHPMEGSGEDILIQDGYAFVVTASGSYGGRPGVKIYDLQWPSFPMAVQFVETFGEAARVAVSDNTIYVAQRTDGLEVIDISDPNNPVKIGAFGTDFEITDVAVDNGFLFVSEGDGGVFATWIQQCTSP
jgi:hypothetical protein